MNKLDRKTKYKVPTLEVKWNERFIIRMQLWAGKEVNGKIFSLHLMVGLKMLWVTELAVRRKSQA